MRGNISLEGVEALENQIGSLRHDIGCAVNELRRWQYAENPVDVQHSIDQAIRMLERS
jgi:hypothetical protein